MTESVVGRRELAGDKMTVFGRNQQFDLPENRFQLDGRTAAESVADLDSEQPARAD